MGSASKDEAEQESESPKYHYRDGNFGGPVKRCAFAGDKQPAIEESDTEFDKAIGRYHLTHESILYLVTCVNERTVEQIFTGTHLRHGRHCRINIRHFLFRG